MNIMHLHERVYRVGHIACGIGAGAKGFNDAQPRVGMMKARFECAGGIDVDAGAIKNFNKMTGAKGTVADLFSRDQYIRFHGKTPPADWKEMMPADLREAFGGYNKHLDVVFASTPCKGLSALLSDAKYQTEKYSALNELTVRAIWLTLEAYKDDPVKIILFENVPRITNRGRPLLDDIQQLLAAYGYCFAETVHDCGEIGGLAQHRKRFLLVARHMGSIPNFLYEPEKKRVRGVGEVIGKLPLPGDPLAGPMHKVPRLQWKTWVRLAFVEAGKDWRSLERLRVANGVLADYTIVPDGNRRENNLGVLGWTETARTMTTQRSPLQGRFSVADPRCIGADYNRGVLGVNQWTGATGVIAGASRPGNGNFSIADPRAAEEAINSSFRIVPCKDPSADAAEAGNVLDPRPGYGENTHTNILRVRGFDETSGAITGSTHPAGGAPAVADPRITGANTHKNVCRVFREDELAGTITGSGRPSSGGGAIADKRTNAVYDVVGNIEPHTLPAPDDRLVARIIALDNTWHRPFTTLEAAALQSLFDPEIFAKGGKFDLESTSNAEKREWIGNAVPSDAARGMAETIGKTLILAASGQTFTLSSDAIWCNPLELALAVNPIQDLPGEMLHG